MCGWCWTLIWVNFQSLMFSNTFFFCILIMHMFFTLYFPTVFESTVLIWFVLKRKKKDTQKNLKNPCSLCCSVSKGSITISAAQRCLPQPRLATNEPIKGIFLPVTVYFYLWHFFLFFFSSGFPSLCLHCPSVFTCCLLHP